MCCLRPFCSSAESSIFRTLALRGFLFLQRITEKCFNSKRQHVQLTSTAKTSLTAVTSITPFCAQHLRVVRGLLVLQRLDWMFWALLGRLSILTCFSLSERKVIDSRVRTATHSNRKTAFSHDHCC